MFNPTWYFLAFPLSSRFAATTILHARCGIKRHRQRLVFAGRLLQERDGVVHNGNLPVQSRSFAVFTSLGLSVHGIFSPWQL